MLASFFDFQFLSNFRQKMKIKILENQTQRSNISAKQGVFNFYRVFVRKRREKF